LIKLESKLWFEEKGKVFGDGPFDILKRIERLGSLRQAAAEIGMSYSQAWELLNGLEDRLGFPLLERRVGGSSGGGSQLSERGRELVQRYDCFRQEATSALEKLFEKYFHDLDV